MKKAFIVSLTLLSIVIILPPIIHGYIYPTAGDDTAWHLIYFQHIDHYVPLYYGQYLVGSMINALPFEATSSFLWFHYAILILVVWSIGLCVAWSVNYLAGILAVLLVYGASQALNLFYYGQIFDLIGIGILLPIALLCVHNIERSIYWKIGAMLSLIAFACFHANGKYVAAILLIMVAYEMYRPQIIARWRMLENRLTVYVGGLGVALLVAPQFGLGQPDPPRLLYDASILFAIIVGILLSKVVSEFYRNKSYYASVIVVFIVACIALFSMVGWFGHNSAIKESDKKAIEIINELPGETCEVSPQVTVEIYGLFINKKIVKNEQADCLVIRSSPMTPQSDPEYFYYRNGDRRIVGEYEQIASISMAEKDRKGDIVIIWLFGRESTGLK